MDTNSNGSVSREELQSALFAFSHMGLIAEPPKMQPQNEFCSPFLKPATIDGDTQSSGCFRCRKDTIPSDDMCGTVDTFNPGEVLLLGEEGVPMKGCWGLDLEFQAHVHTGHSDGALFHCMVKSYAGDAIVARMHAGDAKIIFFVAPKTAFSEQAEAHLRLQQVFDQMDPSQYLCELDVQMDLNTKRNWYRLLIVGEPTQTESDELFAAPDWGAEQTAVEPPSLFDSTHLGDTELAPLIGTSMVRVALGSPASSVASLRTPMGSPTVTPGGGAMKQMAALSGRLVSFTLTPGLPSGRQRPSLMAQGTTPGTPSQSRGRNRTRSRRLSICNPELTPLTAPSGQPRPKKARSRRLSICNPESPADSEDWSDDDDFDYVVSKVSAQKLHVYVLRTDCDSDVGNTTEESVLSQNVWTGLFDCSDCYALGNHYDAVCCRADSSINWSAGGLRNFKLFGLGQQFMTELDASSHPRHLEWLMKAIDLAESDREGRCMHDDARAAGIEVQLVQEEEPSPMGRSRSR